MPNESEIKAEIGHVLLIDIVGYSKLLINQQGELLQTLKRLVQETTPVRNAKGKRSLIRLPTGDGMALVFRSDSEAPLQCALELSNALRQHPELALRMGIHSGPIREVLDVNERANVAGAGIDVAQRVMDCGDAGHILLSKRVADDLAPYPRWNPYLHDLGETEVKHGVRVHLFNLHTDEAGNPARPLRLTEKAEPAISTTASSSKWRPLIFGVLLLFSLGAAVLWFSTRLTKSTPESSSAPSVSGIPEKSIAVLPFENLSEEKGNAYFAAGIQDEILTRLSKIGALKVISRTSTAYYRSSPQNLPEIAKQLGVANILEGSVQKAADQVHINVQLIRAETEEHLWAESYDRELINIFGVEREIAETVASQLKAKLLPQEATELARVPTTNPQAYDLYLKARYIEEQYWNAQVDSIKPAIDLLRKAIELDPHFALAYAELGNAETKMYNAGEDQSPELAADAQVNAAKSLTLQPDLFEGHLLLAWIYLTMKHDNTRALAEFESLQHRLPNDPRVFVGLAVTKAKMGDFQAALSGFLRATELDPHNSQYLRLLAQTYQGFERHAEAERAFEKAQDLAPEDWIMRVNRADILVSQGKLSEAREAMNAWPDAKLKKTALSIKYSVLQAIETYSRNYDAAIAAGRKIPAMGNRIPTLIFPVGDIRKNTDLGFDLLYKGDRAGAREAFAAARRDLEPQRAAHADDPNFYRAAAFIAAGLGERDAALEAARKAVSLTSAEKDAPANHAYVGSLAKVYAYFGEANEAIPLLERRHSTPALLRLDPAWDPIRHDPRFQKLCQEKQP